VATADTWQDTVKAWRGKKIGAQPGGLIEAMTKSFGKSVGLTAGKDFEIVNVGVGPQQTAALKAGVADVASGDAFGAVQIAQSGVGKTVIDFLQQNVPPAFRGQLMTAGFFAPEPRIKQKRALYAGFAAALDEARAFIKDPSNRAQVEQSLVKHVKVPPALAKGLYEQMAGFDIDMSKATVDRTVKVFVNTGLFKAPGPSYADLVTDVGKG
jgi:ABC-type nitrate/sulfonate/bicarbonate transport system substrate-binding protein